MKILMLDAVVYPSPFVAGRDKPLGQRRVNLFNLTDLEWVAELLEANSDAFVTYSRRKWK